MSGGFANFMLGFGGGYIKAKDKEYDRARERKKDEWDDEVRGRQRKEWGDKDRVDTAVRDAAAPRTTMQGTAVTDATGNSNLYQDPAQAQAQAEEARIEAEMRGQNPDRVMTNQATGITGNMTKGHQITAEPVDIAKLNSKEATIGRVTNALMSEGKIQEALTMDNAAVENQAKRLGLQVEEVKFADQMTNRKLGEYLSGGNWYEGATKFISDSQFGPIKDIKAEYELSPDGKKVTLFAVKPDGTREQRGEPYDVSEAGKAKFMENFGKLPLETRMSLIEGREKAKIAAEKDEREYGIKLAELEIKALTAKSQAELRAAQAEASELRARILRGEGGGGSAGQPAFSWEDRRKVLGDAAGFLPDPKSATSAEEATQIQTSNAQTLARFDSVFSTNAQYGIALTAPQIQQAFALSQDPKNVQTKVDSNTGQAFKVVVVNGKPVIIDVGSPATAQPTAAPAAAPAPAAPAPAPAVPGTAAAAARARLQPTMVDNLIPPRQSSAPAAQPQSLADILSVGANSPALKQGAQVKAQQLQTMADTLRAAQAKVRTAAQSGQSPAAAMQEAAQAGAALTKALETMNPQQAALARKALGI